MPPPALLLLLLLIAGAAAQNDTTFYASVYDTPSCQEPYKINTAIRWGRPAATLWYTFVGYVPLPGSNITTGALTWTDVQLQATVEGTNAASLQADLFYDGSGYTHHPRVNTPVNGTPVCVELPSTRVTGAGIATAGSTYLVPTLCTVITAADTTASYDASIAFESSLYAVYVNVSSTGTRTLWGNSSVWSSGAVSVDGLHCPEWTNHLIAVGLVFALFPLLSLACCCWCPVPVMYRRLPPWAREPDEPVTGVQRLWNRVWWRRQGVKLYLAFYNDTYWYGSVLYVAAACLGLGVRVNQNYVNNHPEFSDLVYIIGGGLYLLSSVSYYLCYNGSPEDPPPSAVAEMYSNFTGSLGFYITTILYIYSDVDSINIATQWFELVLYYFWLFEETSNARSWYQYWRRQHEGPPPSLWHHIKAVPSLLLQGQFYANACSFTASFIYMVSQCILVRDLVYVQVYSDDSALIGQWPEFVPPTSAVLKTPPDVTSIQAAGDYLYFFSSMFFLFLTWNQFTVEGIDWAEEDKLAGGGVTPLADAESSGLKVRSPAFAASGGELALSESMSPSLVLMAVQPYRYDGRRALGRNFVKALRCACLTSCKAPPPPPPTPQHLSSSPL